MTFPLDPGLRAFQAREPEHTLLVDPSAQPVSPAGSEAGHAEHAAVTEACVERAGSLPHVAETRS